MLTHFLMYAFLFVFAIGGCIHFIRAINRTINEMTENQGIGELPGHSNEPRA